MERGSCVLDRVQYGDEIRTVLWRPEERTISVDRGIALVAGNQVMQVVLLVHPVPQRHHDIALHALRPLRLGVRQFAFGDTVAPIRQVLDGKRTHARQLADHEFGGLARLHAAHPNLFGRGKLPQTRLNRSRRELA